MWPFPSSAGAIAAHDLPLAKTITCPNPSGALRLRDVPILAVDFEMTGLDPLHDPILSMGFVVIDKGEIQLGTARHILVRAEAGQNTAAVIHSLGHDELERGKPLEDALVALLTALDGKLLLAHHAAIELSFLGRAIKKMGTDKAYWPTICTEQTERKRIAVQQKPDLSVRLFDARARYGLPQYKAHNALTDALATAELFLAQLSHGDKGKDSRIKSYVSMARLP